MGPGNQVYMSNAGKCWSSKRAFRKERGSHRQKTKVERRPQTERAKVCAFQGNRGVNREGEWWDHLEKNN